MQTPPELPEIQKRHEAFLLLPFPIGHRSKMVGNKTLALVQSEIGGLIFTYTGTNGSLGSRQRVVLEESLTALKEALPDFSEEGKAYFQELLEIGNTVLHSAHDQPSF